MSSPQFRSSFQLFKTEKPIPSSFIFQNEFIFKLTGPVCSTGRSRLQEAIDAAVSWFSKNDMIISAAKRAVLSSCDFADVPLPSLSLYIDLGVLADPALRFSAHLASALRSTLMVSNMIF